MIEIIKEKTCAVSGHRLVKPDMNAYTLQNTFIDLIESGIDTFLIGMAVGFDTICFSHLYALKEKYKNIRIIACVPCLNQDKNFSEIDKKIYKEMLESADETVVLSQEYTKNCMLLRNIYMVDRCSVLVCYLRENRGGTFNTVSYAKRKGIKTINI